MSAPSTAIQRFDLSIGYDEFSQAANMKRFICLKALPGLSVPLEAAKFRVVNLKESMVRVEDTKRVPHAGYSRDTMVWGTGEYALDEHGVEEKVDDAEVEKYGDIIRMEQRAIRRNVARMLTKMEYDTATSIFNTTTWNGAALTTTVGTAWTTRATADPLANLDAAREKVQAGSGQQPNTLILSDKAFTAMIRTVRVEDILKGNSITAPILMDAMKQPGLATNSEFMGALCGILRVDRILVGRGVYDSADDGLAVSIGSFWNTTMAMLAYILDDGLDGDLENTEPQLGRTFFSTKNGEPVPGSDAEDSLIFEEYREEQTRGSVYRARNKRQTKILYKECGHLLQGVTA